MKRVLLLSIALLLAAWLGYGARVHSRSAPRPPLPPGEVHGAYHLHTAASDGREPLADVVEAARRAGLRFLVVTDHNVMRPEDAGWHGDVLVVEGSEVSAPYGHVVGLGISRELTREERQKDALGAIGALGGRAVLAHPYHPRRPFTGWRLGGWSGLEVVSIDSLWGRTVADRALGRIALALLDLPWDQGQAMLRLYRYPAEELARYDAAVRAGGRPALLCANDAHGWPSYRAAFEAFSMHLALAPTGDGAADAAAVVDRLLDGSAACVFDAVAPAAGVRLSLAPQGDRFRLELSQPPPAGAAFRLLRDGAPFAAGEPAGSGADFGCGGPCPRPAAFRAEATVGGRPWIFTNPVRIE